MKKITLLLSLLSFLGVFAQKQIQPYSYTLTSEDKKDQTILIYASASSVNRVKFTLKNSKNEFLKDKEKNNISFEVFPFTELSFRDLLASNILKIAEDKEPESKEAKVDTDYSIFKSKANALQPASLNTSTKAKLENRASAVKTFRNVYQYFNALVNTAFQYDTEPIAGILRYNEAFYITKRVVNGFDTDYYFNKQAKYLRYNISRSKVYNEYLSESKYLCVKSKISFNLSNFRGLEPDNFMKWIRDNPDILLQFWEYYQNAQTGKIHGANNDFKRYAEKELKLLYNQYEFEKFFNDEIIDTYISSLIQRINVESKINRYKEEIQKRKEKIDSIGVSIEKINISKINIRDKAKIEGIKRDSKYKLLGKNDVDNTMLIDQKNKILRQIKDFNVIIENYDNEIKKIEEKEKASLENKKEKETILNKYYDSINNQSQVRKIAQGKIDAHISKYRTLFRRFPVWEFKMDEIELDINDGFLEHMTVVGTINRPYIDQAPILAHLANKNDTLLTRINETKSLNVNSIIDYFYKEPIVKEIYKGTLGEKVKFENQYPMGFSYKTDYADLFDYKLFYSEGHDHEYEALVADVIRYQQRHQNDRLDFSPKDQVVRLPEQDPNREGKIELKKETSSKILAASVYTDFIGLEEEEANGLVQIEVEKFIPLWTKRMPLGLGRNSNLGIANYTNLGLTWSKISEKLDELPVQFQERSINNTPITDRYVTYLNLMEYENLSVGADLNLVSLELPIAKVRLEINAGIRYGRTKVIDSISSTETNGLAQFDKSISTIRYYPDFIMKIRPEERFGGFVRFRPFKMIVPETDDFFAVSDDQLFLSNRRLSREWLHRYELGAHFLPSKETDNKFFFRYIYNNTANYEDNGFNQVQVGYLIYLKF